MSLPRRWIEAKVGEVAENISYGFTAKATTSPVGPKLLRITDIQDGSVQWDSVPYCKISKDRVTNYVLKNGDIVFARTGATTGKSFLIKTCPEAVFASYLIRVRPSNSIMSEFLAHFFQSAAYWTQISDNISGSAQPNCNATKLSNLSLPIPPIDEQRRIVAKLEKLFAKLDACQKRLAYIPIILKRFRQSVLAAACSGRLTADWRERNPCNNSIGETIETIQRKRKSDAKTATQKEKLRQIYEATEENDSNELPETWQFVALNKICRSFDYGTSAKSHPSGKIPVLRMGNIQNGKIDWADLVFTSDEKETQDYLLKPKTVLFNRTNSPELVGKTAIYRGERPAIFAGYLIRVNHLPELNPEYLNLCLNTNYAKEFCRGIRTDGVSQSNINAQKLGTFEVPFCPIDEQNEIVRRVEELFALSDKIEARYAKAQWQVNKLTQSLLAKAFRGELVPQDELVKASQVKYSNNGR